MKMKEKLIGYFILSVIATAAAFVIRNEGSCSDHELFTIMLPVYFILIVFGALIVIEKIKEKA